LARPSRHSTHRPLHGIEPGAIQRFLAHLMMTLLISGLPKASRAFAASEVSLQIMSSFGLSASRQTVVALDAALRRYSQLKLRLTIMR
jgi:hypothetical protein